VADSRLRPAVVGTTARPAILAAGIFSELFEPANLRSRFRSERNTSIVLVPLSDPRTRLSRFAFNSDFFFGLERIRFTSFISPLIQRVENDVHLPLHQAHGELRKEREPVRVESRPTRFGRVARPPCLETTVFSSPGVGIRGLPRRRYRAVTREPCERW